MECETLLLAVVDDDGDVRIALTRLVSSAVFAVESATSIASGAEFLHSVEDHEPDCLVLDTDMSVMSGFELQGALAVAHAARGENRYAAGTRHDLPRRDLDHCGEPSVTRDWLGRPFIAKATCLRRKRVARSVCSSPKCDIARHPALAAGMMGATDHPRRIQ
ncbi:MAG TPA: response regulator [Rubrivivax sp.]|nr:response regulator [Rubrivivax sp.]